MASLVKTDKISTTAGGAQEFTIPAADGTANQHLKTDGSGVLGWATPPTGIALTGSTNTWIPTITGADALTGTANFTYDGNVLDVKNSGTASSINLYCESSNAHYTKIKSGPHASATSYTITLPNAPPTVTGQALTATTAGVASWATVSSPALSHVSQWVLTAELAGTAAPITANLAEPARDGYARVGSAMTESSGAFTFPVTGIWRIDASFCVQIVSNLTYRYGRGAIYISTDSGSSWDQAANATGSHTDSSAFDEGASQVQVCHIFDVTNTSTHQVRFHITQDPASTYLLGSANYTHTNFIFSKIGDT